MKKIIDVPEFGNSRMKMWALEVRDNISQIVNKTEQVNPLADFTTEQLQAELARRLA